MNIIVAGPSPFAAAPNAGFVNAAGQVFDVTAKVFAAAPSTNVTTPTIAFKSPIYATLLLVSVPNVPWPATPNSQWLVLTDFV